MRMFRQLVGTARPAMVIASNGICLGGRSVNYLKAVLNILFVGYQGSRYAGSAYREMRPERRLC